MVLRRVPRRRSRKRPPGGGTSRRPIRVLIADDHRLFLEGVTGLLKRQGFTIVGVAVDGDEAVTVACATQPDVALLDVAMPKRSGLDVARALLTDSPGTAVVLMTGQEDQAIVLEGMTLGVRGFVVKTVATEELVDAIYAAARGATYVSPVYGPAVAEGKGSVPAVDRPPLTPRQRDVLRLIAAGNTNAEIAATLGISPRTVDTHRTHIMRKLDIHDLAGLVRYAIREGIATA
jgi:DNA-binding NarL/FixJ family response regulator